MGFNRRKMEDRRLQAAEDVFRIFRCAYRLGSYHWHLAEIVDQPREDQGMIE
jgi:hypothetical protein